MQLQTNLSNMDTKGIEKVSMSEKCLISRGHRRDIIVKAPVLVSSVFKSTLTQACLWGASKYFIRHLTDHFMLLTTKRKNGDSNVLLLM